MKRALLMTWAMGLALLVVQSVLLQIFPFPWCPDLLLLATLALGLHWPARVSGLVLAAALGFCADFLSGSLAGQHVLVYLVTFTGTSLLSRPLVLRGPVPLALFAVVVTVVAAAVAWSSSMLLSGVERPSGAWLLTLGLHALVNALLAPGFCAGAAAVLQWLAGESGAYRPVRIESHSESV